MASPFSIFRKHQRVMLAGVTILAMIGFVFFVPFGRGGSGPRGGGQGVEVATWKFGTIYQSDVNNRLYARRLVNEFIKDAFDEARSKGGFQTGRRPPQPFPNDTSSVLTTILLQKKAEQMGIVVSDAAINDFIDAEVTDNKLTGAEEMAILQKFNTPTQTRLSQDQLFDALRFELQARNLERLLISDVASPGTPEQRYDYFSRLYRKATIQVMPVTVKDFADKVPDPTDNELRAFFEKYKDDLSNPNSPEPGFKEPTRAKFQYFLAKQEDLIKEEKPKVTNDEIKDYYEKHKEQFRKSADEGTDSLDKSKKPDTSAKPDAAVKPDAGKSDQKSGNSEKKPDASAGGKTREPGKDAGTGATGAAPSPEKPASAKAATDKDAGKSDKPAASKATDKVPADSKSPDAKGATGSGKSAALAPSPRHRAVEELIALADGNPLAVPSVPAAKDETKPDAAKAPAKTADKSPAANKPVADAASVGADGKTSAGDKTAAPKTESPKIDTAKSTVSGTGNPDLDLKPNEAPKKIPIVEYDSLDSEKVRDQIRTSIAREKVGQQIDDAFKALSTEISTYRRKHSAWAVKKEGEAPTLPEFRALAKARGLKFEETGLVSAQQAYDTTELGKSFSITFTADERPQQAYFVQQAFHANIPNYSPYTMFSSDDELNFLWWRVDYREAFVPDFDKVKSEVLEAWKMVEARKLALAQAKEYADQANKQHSELKEMFQFEKNLHVSQIGPFTWMSQLSVAQNPEQPAPLQMTQLSGVDKAGDEFMRTVFGLDGGSAGVAMNEPQTIAYVIQAISFDPAETVFRREFLNRMANPFGDVSLQSAQGDAYQALRAKMNAIRAEFDFKPAPGSAAQTAAASPGSSDESDD